MTPLLYTTKAEWFFLRPWEIRISPCPPKVATSKKNPFCTVWFAFAPICRISTRKQRAFFNMGSSPLSLTINSISTVYEPSQASFEFTLRYPLPETDLLAPFTGGKPILKTPFSLYTICSTRFLRRCCPNPPPVEMAINATAKVSTAPPRPSFMSKRPFKIPKIHCAIQSPEPNACQECTQSFPTVVEL